MAECRKMHGIIERHRLTTGFRWVVAQTDRSICGELYRSVGDTRGAFCQPAFYEAFGLTVIEAMISGLPTFATSSGGPAEIIRDGVSGFHIDPHLADEAQAKIEDFFERCHQDPSHWDDISRQAIQRIEARYTWREYSRRLTSCCAVYSFWAQLTSLERHAAHRYLELFWHSVFRPLVKGMQSTSTSEEA
jgi:sucrose synthase